MLNPLSQQFFDFQNESPYKKSSKAYGKSVASKFVSSIKKDTNGFFQKRNKRIERNISFARGKQPMKEFVDLLGIDAKQSFVNLDTKPPAIAPVFMELLASRFMEREERPTVKAVDKYSKEKKRYQSQEAAYRMRNGDDIVRMSEEAGMPMEDPEAFTPEDEQDLSLWEQTEQHLPQELAFQKLIKDVLDDNNYTVFKRRGIDDFSESGYAVAEVFRDGNGNIKLRNCITKNVFWTYTDYDDFHDVLLIGELQMCRISELRISYPDISEDRWYKMYISTTQDPQPHTWQEVFMRSDIRPYDDALVEVFKFGIKASEDISYLKKTDSFGKAIISKLDKPKEKYSENEEVISKRIGVIYRGCYVVGIDDMLEWGIMSDAIKPHWALHEVLHPYCIYMPQNREMVNMAMIERVETNIVQMTVDLLKMQQLKSEMRPDELAIDVTQLGDIDLGQGSMQPFETQKIFQQTGKLYYKSLDDDGNTPKNPPIQPIPVSSFANKMQVLMEDYNFHLNQLKLYIGTDPSIDSQSINPRLSPTIQNNQVQASNRSTEFVYDSYISWLQGIAKRIAIMCWDDIVIYGKDKGIDKEEIKDMVFDLNISMLPTTEEIGYIDELVKQAVAAKIITFEEGFRVRRYAKEDAKLAEIYLGKYEAKRKREEQQQAQQNQEYTMQAQLASNQQTAKNEQSIKQAEISGKEGLQKLQNAGEMDKILFTLIKDAIIESQKTGQQIPPYLAPMVPAYLQNISERMGLQMGENQMQGFAQMMQQQQISQAMQQQAQPEPEQQGQEAQPEMQ